MKLLMALWLWFDERTGISRLIGPFLIHPVPPETATVKIGWMYVFGVATLTCFIVQVVTGIALATLYVPSTADAYASLQFITDQAAFGSVLRGIHYWGASAMVLFIGIHMIRVFLTGSFKFPREVNWLTGVVLLLFTVAMAFTGQLLRWDQNGVWSLFIAAEQAGRFPVLGNWIGQFILGGKTVGASTLSRFFAYHVFFFPAVLFATVGFHLYLVLHNGVSELPRAGPPIPKERYRAWYHDFMEREGVPYFPEAAWHEIAFAVLLVIVIVALAAVIGPPHLDNPPNPANVNAYPRPDWYLLWYFALLAFLRPSAESWVIILAPLLAFLLLFLIPFLSPSNERRLVRRPWAPAAVIILVIMIGSLWKFGVTAPWSPNFNAQPLTAAQIGTSSGPVASGAQLFYDKGCEFCHTVDGSGGRRGPDLTHVADRLSAGEITEIIANGPGNMPAYVNTLSPTDMESIVAFLEAQGGQPPQASPATTLAPAGH
jgi:ubiquinol-cytochrome c reductase cytochrome b subunit